MPTQVASKPITDDERTKLAEFERAICGGFLEAGRGYASIFNKRLYRGDDGDRTWEQYLKEVHDTSTQSANYLMRAWQHVNDLPAKIKAPKVYAHIVKAMTGLDGDQDAFDAIVAMAQESLDDDEKATTDTYFQANAEYRGIVISRIHRSQRPT